MPFSENTKKNQIMPKHEGEAICFDTIDPGLYNKREKLYKPLYYFENSDSTKKSDKKFYFTAGVVFSQFPLNMYIC